eukprot:TRINITY_DN5637_c0_g1_i2.p1 TRINITY_DN5637_c0_g1~~TRINITY_DN5637_c0_g1_i2.p1  ORF type:complete len:332 (+),score=43.18 TRINITY_DN5637_c0_g1_i2:58-1053(+)
MSDKLARNIIDVDIAFDDLCCRFILNCPEEEYTSFERICFQIEQAHWFYEDFHREINHRLPSFSLKEFARHMFKHCPILQPYANATDTILANFKNYKIRVPVCGAILLNPSLEKCVLVKGWQSRSSWGFPKGKINKDESEINCATREVFEETGFSIKSLIREDDFIELTVREQKIKLYIIPGISEFTIFIPQTRKEISKIEWHFVSDLPSSNSSHNKIANNFYLVVPFVSKLKLWINQLKRSNPSNNFQPKIMNRSSNRTSPEKASNGERSLQTSPNKSTELSAKMPLLNGHSTLNVKPVVEPSSQEPNLNDKRFHINKEEILSCFDLNLN